MVISKTDLQTKVLLAARDNSISSVLFRNATRRRLGLSIADSECLSLLAAKGTLTPTKLARYTGLTSGSTTVMLDRLEKERFITRTPNTRDRRGILVTVSDRYTKAAEPLVTGVLKAHQDLLASYSVKELEMIEDFLIRFAKNVTEQTIALDK